MMMKKVVAFTCLILHAQLAQALQMILATMDKMCIAVMPIRVGSTVTVEYIVTGIGESNVDFDASVNGKVKQEFKQAKEGKAEMRATTKQPIDVCWQKTDKKSKKVNFLISQSLSDLDEKASPGTIESIGERIDGLLIKLDEISMQIQSQQDTEKTNLEISQQTISNHTWMSIAKMMIVLMVCAGQIYFTTSFFNKGGGARRSNNDINPFARSSI